MTYRDEPGTETAICAAPGCGAEFTKRPGANHQKYCSRKCRNVVGKAAAAERDAAVSRHAKRLRMEAEAFGGTTGDGSLVCGTLSLGRRPEYDPRNPPADDARFW